MEISIKVRGVALAVVAAAAVLAWLAYDRFLPRNESSTGTTIATPEVPVVMRTPGGLLEIATVRAYERFSRSDTREFWGIPLGTTVSQIQVTVLYRYHIEMAREWPLLIAGKTCIVRAGQVKPTLPVAFDTTTLQKYSKAGWARFNSDENLELLERSLTPELGARAGSAGYLQLAKQAGRKTVAEFVTTWLLKERQWKRDPDFRVMVLFPGETEPGPGAAKDSARALE